MLHPFLTKACNGQAAARFPVACTVIGALFPDRKGAQGMENDSDQ